MIEVGRASRSALMSALALVGLIVATAAPADTPGQAPAVVLAHGYTCYPNGQTISCFKPAARTARSMRCFKDAYGGFKCYGPSDAVGRDLACFVSGDHYYECHAPREHVAIASVPDGFKCYPMANGFMECMTPPATPAPPPVAPPGFPTPPHSNN